MRSVAAAVAALLAVALLPQCSATYYLSNKVWDGFVIEGEMQVGNPLILNFGYSTYWKMSWNYLGIPYNAHQVQLRIEFKPSTKQITWGPSFYFSDSNGNQIPIYVPGYVQFFDNLDFGWSDLGSYNFYWKIQIEKDGFKIWFNDFQSTNWIEHMKIGTFTPYVYCCQYPINSELEILMDTREEGGVSTGGANLGYERDFTAYFTKNYPCIHPCDIAEIKEYFCCHGSIPGQNYFVAPDHTSCRNYKGFASRTLGVPGTASTEGLGDCSSTPPVCHLTGLSENAGGICMVPSMCDEANGNWCDALGQGHICVLEDGIYQHDECLNTTRRRKMFAEERRLAAQKIDIERVTSRRKLATKRGSAARRRQQNHLANLQSAAALQPEHRRSGTVDDRHKARNEVFAFNFRYLHPQCWRLENVMYEYQNTDFFAPLFYWCYSAYWCFSATPSCTRDGTPRLMPRHVYDAKVNSCLGVRGTVWTDLSIKEVLLDNSTNSSIEDNFNISANGTIYAVAAAPPKPEEDLGLTYLTRLPLWPSIFGTINCTGEDEFCGLFPEGMPGWDVYPTKNLGYLMDWVDGVNYQAYLAQRRRTYRIPGSKWDYARYCDTKLSSTKYVRDFCHEHALCLNRRQWPGYSCRCEPGYDGDGYLCAPAPNHLEVTMPVGNQELDINATLRLLSEEFERRTGRPAETFDVNSYINTRAFIHINSDGSKEIRFFFSFQNESTLALILDGDNVLDVLGDDLPPVKIKNATDQNPTDGLGDPPSAFLSASTVAAADGVGVQVAQDASEEANTVTAEDSPEVADVEQPAAQPETEPEPEQPSGPDPAALFAGGGVAGVVALVALGIVLRRRGAEAEAPVVAVHSLDKASVVVDMDNSESDSRASADYALEAKAGTRVDSFKASWRKGQVEDSFKLAQDRSWI